MAELVIRRARASDTVAIAQIFFDAVHEGTKEVYDEAQRRAWGGEAPDPERWAARLEGLDTVVAERDGKVVGFLSLAKGGLVDLAFVAPDAIGAGVAWRLYGEIERIAREQGVSELVTDASFKARPFFARQGFEVVREQRVTIRGAELTNFRMRKRL